MDQLISEEDRQYAMDIRYGLLKQLDAIERRYLPDFYEERLMFRRWREEQRMEGRKEKRRIAVT